MTPGRPSPLISAVELQPRNSATTPSIPDHDESILPQKRWYHYIPLGVTVGLILTPQPSIIWMLVDYHLRTLNKPIIFTIHLLVIYTLIFLSFSSLIICVARDPGPANTTPTKRENYGGTDDEQVGIMEALLPDIDYSTPGRWCRKCWAPKPERTHHCSICGRCVLKMDHHCPWLGSTCIGHRTYPAFVHFLCCVTLLAIYISIVSIYALIYAFDNPFVINELTPIHELALAFSGVIFTLVIGSFACYHLYLVSTNQTTLENISPFLLLRHLPSLPRTDHSLSDPPLEPELSYHQRRLVKDAHAHIFMYDVGWQKNWAQVFGWKSRFGWLRRLFCGGASLGDGRTFPRNPRSDEMLARLATELVKLDRNV